MGLFNHRILEAALKTQPAASDAQREVARLWAESIRNLSIHTQNESQIESVFHAKILVGLLGYRAFDGTTDFTFRPKQPMAKGEADVVLGHFGHGSAAILAPLELKGTDTPDLDAPVKGKSESTVQQAWRYANAISGIKWVLASNMLEIRLYGFGEGQQDYERIDLAKIDQPAELAKAQLLLSAENLLGPRLGDLLRQSKQADKELSVDLYSDYSALRVSLIDAVNAATDGADKVQAVNTAQKILDRVLFVAFAEDRALLPAKSLNEAFVSKDRYNPKPVWDNFKSLFRWIDLGNPQENIAKYNGGLFKFDEKVDTLELNDDICEEFKKIGEYHFDTEVSVTVLGHIFEQSVSDVEKLLAKARGEVDDEPEKSSGVKGRRKRDGIVYTPDYIAKFIVEKTLGTHVEELFRDTIAQFAKGDVADYDKLKFKKGEEVRAWVAYRLALKTLRVVDPACGSGVFLVTAFDYLKAEYDRVNKKIAELRGTSSQIDIEDVDREILTENLYGVDVNAESVEITKLSLWLKTAKQGKELDSLDHNIRVGDSLIEDSSFAYLKHGFSWNSAFPEVFASGGFDVVLGNPPYVRMELIKLMKPYLERRYEVVDGRADLYFYFFERGVRLLKIGGRLGYVCNSTFLNTKAAIKLRAYLLKACSIENLVNFGDIQIFDGVATLPLIMTLSKNSTNSENRLGFWKVKELPFENFETAYLKARTFHLQSSLTEAPWHFEGGSLSTLRDKIVRGKKTLKDIYGSPLYGIKTGLNEAFVIGTDIRDRLIAKDPKSELLLKPFLEGKDIKRWRPESRGLWLIYIPKNRIDIADYPAVKEWLENYKVKLEKRATKQRWYELQQAQEAYGNGYTSPRVFYAHFNRRYFFYTVGNYLPNDKGYVIPTTDKFLCALLNSNALWFIISDLAPQVIGGSRELRAHYMDTLPIPQMSEDIKSLLSKFVDLCHVSANSRLNAQNAVSRRIPDLCSPDRSPKLSTKLQEWWKFESFAAFRAEVKKVFKSDIPLKERSDWEDLFNTGKAEIEKLSAEIKRNEDEINAIVYKLFDLTPDDITLLEESISAR